MLHPTDLTVAFRQAGLKVTPQRQVLFQLLHDNGLHPTAEALHSAASERIPGISLRTVYQTLNDLVAMGQLRTVDVGSGAVRFDPNLQTHHHAVCELCGAVHDVYVDGADALLVEGLDGFRTRSTTMIFAGMCAECAAAGTAESGSPSPSTNH